MAAMLPAHLEGKVDIEPWCQAPEEAMLALFHCVERRCGSVDAYLDSVGVDADLRARCAEALTVAA